METNRINGEVIFTAKKRINAVLNEVSNRLKFPALFLLNDHNFKTGFRHGTISKFMKTRINPRG